MKDDDEGELSLLKKAEQGKANDGRDSIYF
jgi:hypothetical protein